MKLYIAFVVATLCTSGFGVDLLDSCVSGETCVFFTKDCLEAANFQEAEQQCQAAHPDARLCHLGELKRNQEKFLGSDKCSMSIKDQLVWSMSKCSTIVRRRKRRGIAVYRGQGGATGCETVLSHTRFFPCCVNIENAPTGAPTPAIPEEKDNKFCEKLSDREQCQQFPWCEFEFSFSAKKPDNNYGCFGFDEFCGYETESQCTSRCALHRCRWNPDSRTCSKRPQYQSVYSAISNSTCNLIEKQEECSGIPGCKWFAESVQGGKEFTYGCREARTFCGYNQGTKDEIEAQCKLHIDKCYFSCNQCRTRAQGEQEDQKQILPNIIISIADDLGWDDTGINNPRIYTPTLNELAKSGIILDRHYSSRFCSPSRSMLLTGNLPWRNGEHTDINMNPYDSLRCGLHEELQIFPKILQSAGYSTHLVGKWHLGHYRPKFLPTARGFDSFVGYFGGIQSIDVPSMNFKIGHGKKCTCKGNALKACGWKDLANCATAAQLFNATKEKLEVVPDEAFSQFDFSDLFFADQVSSIIKHHEGSERPFFIYAGFDSPHDPHNAPKRFQDLNRESVGDSTCTHRTRLKLAGMVSALDQAHKTIVDTLRSTKAWENTILVFFSDNGGYNEGGGRNYCPQNYKRSIGSSNYPLRGSKYTFFEGGIRTISFVAGGSDRIPTKSRGKVFNGLFSVSDWFKTLLTAAGVKWIAGKQNQANDSIDQWSALTELQSASESPRQTLAVQIWNAVKRYVLIQNLGGKTYKLLFGYPGYITGMDWIREPNKARRKSEWDRIHIPVERPLSSVPSIIRTASQFDCMVKPCLFDISTDPSETVNLYHSRQDIYSQMISTLVPYISQELPMDKSGLCAVQGPKLLLDGAAITQARKCNSFAPWLHNDGDSPLSCPPLKLH